VNRPPIRIIDCLETLTFGEEEDLRGNASASGDDRQDRLVEDELIRRLNTGDPWAWFWVRLTLDHDGLSGEAQLGGCSYDSEDDFRAYLLPDMRAEALQDLQDKLDARAARCIP
jgi:hypothetical protein